MPRRRLWPAPTPPRRPRPAPPPPRRPPPGPGGRAPGAAPPARWGRRGVGGDHPVGVHRAVLGVQRFDERFAFGLGHASNTPACTAQAALI
ncbi:hypothetical protein, partial [Nocardia abscessus]|uniref:hypothetical protein n=1 Tax=Nocardia abscessus TaxID=120957 RepID=UPI002456C856